MRLFTTILQLLLPSSYILVSEASFGPLSKWKVENGNSYIIYNGIYIPNPEQMIDPNSILDSLNPVSRFNNFWKSMPSFNFFGGGGGDHGTQYNQYGSQYPYDQYADPSTMSASYQTPQAAGSEPITSIAEPEEIPVDPSSPSSSSSSSFASLFGFGSSSSPDDTATAGTSPVEDSPTTFAVEAPSSTTGDISNINSGNGLSSYLPWNWFSSRSSTNNNPLTGNAQLPDEFQFLMTTPFQINRRSSDGHPTFEPPSDHTHNAENEKVSVYYRPIGQGSFLRYEVHEPTENNPARNTQVQANLRGPANSRKRRSTNEQAEATLRQDRKSSFKRYIPKFLKTLQLNAPEPTSPSEFPTSIQAIEAVRKSNLKSNRRRYFQLQKEKRLSQNSHSSKSQSSTLLSKFQKLRKIDNVDDSTKTAMMNIGDEFPCPKVGFWSYNGDVCIALGPVPKWACKPNDLATSGKLVVCRNKIMMS